MKKTAIAISLVLALLFSSIAELQTLEIARANFIPTVSMEITSPLNGKTYDTMPLLKGYVNFYAWGNISKFAVYSLDDSANDTLTGNFVNHDEICWFNVSTALPRLSVGKHSIKVHAWVDVENSHNLIDHYSSEVSFYVNKEIKTLPDGSPYKPPIVTVLSPAPNGIISTSDVPLNVTAQIFGFVYHIVETMKCLNYSLDGLPAVQMNLNMPHQYAPGYYVYANDMLKGLSEGTHNLTIYGETSLAWLERFNTTLSFNVDPSTKSIAGSFPPLFTIVAVSVIATAIGVSTVLLTYHRKHRCN